MKTLLRNHVGLGQHNKSVDMIIIQNVFRNSVNYVLLYPPSSELTVVKISGISTKPNKSNQMELDCKPS